MYLQTYVQEDENRAVLGGCVVQGFEHEEFF